MRTKAHRRIVVRLPNLQHQLRMVDRITGMATEPELERWQDIAGLLTGLYAQLQRRRQVTVYRAAGTRSSP